MRLVADTRVKINAWLRVLPLREGHALHELESLFLPVAFGDRIIVEAYPSSVPEFHLTSNRPSLLAGNSVEKAWEAFSRAPVLAAALPCFWIQAHLEKRVPDQTGLGAGSGDAGAMLLLLNELHGFPLNRSQLRALACALGSDVPFFVESTPCIVRGTGELLEPLLPFADLTCCIVLPSFRVDTKAAYSMLDQVMTSSGISATDPSIPLEMVIRALRDRMPLHSARFNAFDVILGEHTGTFLEIRNALMTAGALFSDLSGSGSAIFGIYTKRAAAEAAALEIRRRFKQAWTIVAQIL